MLAKSLPRKQVPTKKFLQKGFWSKIFYGSKTSSLSKFSSTNFLVEILYGCKIISSKQGSYKKLGLKKICRKFFMFAKPFSRKIGGN
jgi:hypothetical protein